MTWKAHIDDRGNPYWQGWISGLAIACVWSWGDGVYHTGGSGKHGTLLAAKAAVEASWA